MKLCITILVFVFSCTESIGQSKKLLKVLDPSFQGDSHYSLYNSTDWVVPYHGVDSWIEFRAHGWFERKHIFGPFVSAIGSNMFYLFPKHNVNPFDWQRYVQGTVGLEFYPANIWIGRGVPNVLKGIRFYGWISGRKYYGGNRSIRSTFQKNDSRIGLDYYFDNILNKKSTVHWSLWTDASRRSSNFSHPDYNVFFTNGLFRIGHSRSQNSTDRRWFSYLFGDWAFASGCPCRWWENVIKPGLGIAYFPIENIDKTTSQEHRLFGFRRVNFYLEWMVHAIWLGDNAPTEVIPWDIRFGVSFSTSRLLGGK
ncbi:MAG: hypothetical protein R8P61_22595 [Bacteroidia bacterium]|nr:hypothetical protein [Bacteroidia bacterium]